MTPERFLVWPGSDKHVSEPQLNAGGSVMFGSVHSRFGIRKPPTAAYATQSPGLFFDDVDGTYVGGNFGPA